MKIVLRVIKWLTAVKKYWLAVFIGFAFAILCFIALEELIKPVSTSSYCGSKCHEMNTAYQTWKLSEHAANKYGIRVECVDCHLPPKEKYFSHMAVKAYKGTKDIFEHHFGEKYDLEKNRVKVIENMSNQSCLTCHNDLLAKPSSELAKKAHMLSLNAPDDPKHKCLSCHESTGHER